MYQPAMILNHRVLIGFAALTINSFAAAQGINARSTVTTTDVAQIVAQVQAPGASDNVLEYATKVGGILLREGRYSEAVELLSVLANKKPNDASVIYGQALAIFNTGRVENAEPLARRAADLARNGSDGDRVQAVADALVLLGVILAVKGDDAAALKALQEATRIAPSNFDAQFALGRGLYGVGDSNGATKAFRAARVLQPSNPQALFFLATALEHSGETEEALATYRELITQKPNMSEGHLGLGVLLLKGKGVDAEEGLKELERALEINPNLYEAHVTAGRALIASGRALAAIPYLVRAAELAPNNPEPHYQLSLAYRRLGRNQEAAEQAAIVKRIHESRRNAKVTR